MEKFTKEKDELLIEFVKCNSILYDSTDKNFKNNVLKHKVWENISGTLNISITDCKKRWKHLRDHYMKKKKNESSTGQARSSMNNWEYMIQLAFLSNTPTQRPTLTNVYLESQETTNLESYEDNNVESQDTQNSSINQIDREQSPTTSASNVTVSNVVEPDKVTATHADRSADDMSRPAKKKKKNTDASLLEILKKRDEQRSNLLEKLSAVPEENPIKKFFEAMGETVAKFPPQLAAETRLKVCQVVTEMEMKMHQSSSLTPMPSEDSWNLYDM